jgi:hypothetical protein
LSAHGGSVALRHHSVAEQDQTHEYDRALAAMAHFNT